MVANAILLTIAVMTTIGFTLVGEVNFFVLYKAVTCLLRTIGCSRILISPADEALPVRSNGDMHKRGGWQSFNNVKPAARRTK